MDAFITSFVFVVLAEMGDKTQLLAMCMATRFRWQTVLWGVFAATVVNHFVAVEAGNYLTRFVSMDTIQLAAAVSFILFGLWTIRGDEIDDSCDYSRRSPFWTVAIAFFLAEMGDKTQLATIALAAKFHTVVPVWAGTTAGMMVADAIGIVIGVAMGKRIPERLVQWFAALVFIGFGFAGLYENLPPQWVTVPVFGGLSLVVLLLIAILVRKGRKQATAE